MRILLVSAAAVMAITGAATLGYAQTQDSDKGKGPAAEEKAPGSGGAQRAPGESDRAQQPAPNRTEKKSEPRKGAEREPGKDQPRAAQQNDKDRSNSATPQQRDTDKQKSTDQRKGSDDKSKAADQRKGDNDKQKAADQRKGDDKQKAAKSSNLPQAGRIQVTEEKRSGVRERLVKDKRVDRVQRSRINVSINIGTAFPRSVRLHRFPTTVVSFAPAYRGYSYVLLEDDTIVVVDERTYVIVDVIPAGTQRADGLGRHLTLSADDMRFIYRIVPKDRTADVRVRLGLGAEVPRDVALLAFPDEVVDRVPGVRRYRYIVAQDDIVIVNPDDHAVALVISE